MQEIDAFFVPTYGEMPYYDVWATTQERDDWTVGGTIEQCLRRLLETY